MIRAILYLPAILAMTLFAINPSVAKPKISVKTKYYAITGDTSAELKRQMNRKGPRGNWARADWYVRWSGSCRLSLEIRYVYPKWKNKSQAPAALRKKWDRMMKALQKHEKQHGQHGINAAREIESSKCASDPKEIVRKWANQDRKYDRRTNHGLKEGVVLP